MGIDERTPVILAVGRHEWQKGLDVLLEAMPVIGQPSAGLVLVAGRQGAQTPLLEGIVANRRPSGWQISFLGARDDVADLLVAADVLAFPSRWEGLPGTLIEALALETPVVATDIAPVAEVVAGLPGVRLVPPDEPDALANALRAALSGRPVDVTGHRDRFQRRYEITAVAQRTLEFYEAALR